MDTFQAENLGPPEPCRRAAKVSSVSLGSSPWLASENAVFLQWLLATTLEIALQNGSWQRGPSPSTTVVGRRG